MAARALAFGELWALVSTTNKSSNGLCYHPCCDTWTTRGATTKRASHSNCLKWQKLSSTLDKSIEDKKQALQAKMIEEGWRLPALLNEVCSSATRQTGQPQVAFKLHQPLLQPQDSLASLTPQNLAEIRFDQPEDLAQSNLYLISSFSSNKYNVSRADPPNSKSAARKTSLQTRSPSGPRHRPKDDSPAPRNQGRYRILIESCAC